VEVYVKPLWKSREVFLCPKITSFETSGYPGLFSLEEEMGIIQSKDRESVKVKMLVRSI